jgi:cytochrome c biogenesis protein CcmG/thiol:disulfide interchange protein DsbE
MRGLGVAFVALVLAALMGLLAFGLMNDGEGELGALRQSREAPDFTLDLFDGGTFTLSENRGQPVVVNFWSSWCDSCRVEAPVLERGWRSFQDRGVIFIGVNVMDSRGDAEAFMEEFDVTYPNGPDESGIRFDYGTTGHPETFFINRDGVIVLKYIGPLNDERLSAFAEELLQ